MDETIGASNPANDPPHTRDTFDQPHMLDIEKCPDVYLVRQFALRTMHLKGYYSSLELTTPQCHRRDGKITAFSVVRNIQQGRACCIILCVKDLYAPRSAGRVLKCQKKKDDTYFDGTIKDRLEVNFVKQLVRKHVRILIVLFPPLLPPASGEKRNHSVSPSKPPIMKSTHFSRASRW
jgi:hypothetical protein